MSDDGGHIYPEGSDRCERCFLTRAFVERLRVACPGQRAAGEEHGEGLPDQHGHAPSWHHFPIQTLVEAGVLQYINRTYLWPLGLALNVTVPTAGGERDYGSAVLCVIEPEPLDEIVSAGVDRRRAYRRFVRERKAAIRQTQEERGA